MKFDFNTRGKPVQVRLQIVVAGSKPLRVLAYDRDFPKTILWDRTATTTAADELVLKMPLSPKTCSVLIYNDSLGAGVSDSGIKVVSKKLEPLQRELKESQISDTYLREFVVFAERFSYNAQYLDPGKSYQSSNRHFVINYADVIKSAKGMPQTTPARISIDDPGLMEFSKQRLSDITVPGIMAIALHEFSHNFLNRNGADEQEADLNGLIIYLGLGFPLVEAYKAWDNIYQHTSSELNQVRSNKVTQLLLDYAKELGNAA